MDWIFLWTKKNLISIHFGRILTQFVSQFLETGTSDRCLIYLVQRLRFSGFRIYPRSLFLYSPFKGHSKLRLQSPFSLNFIILQNFKLSLPSDRKNIIQIVKFKFKSFGIVTLFYKLWNWTQLWIFISPEPFDFLSSG